MGAVYTVAQRVELRERLIQHARDDRRIVAAALVGSAARGDEDRWSDIDLALRLAPGETPETVADDWTDQLRSWFDVADTHDVRSGGGLYRVFLGTCSLQVDVSFFPDADFVASNGEPMSLVFGDQALSAPARRPADWRARARLGWLYALHARSAIGRGRWWQAEIMLNDLRAETIALACIAAGVNPHDGRAAHLLGPALLAELESSRAPQLGADELGRSLGQTCSAYLRQVGALDPDFAGRLAPALEALVGSVSGT